MSSVTQDFTGQGQQISRLASARRKPLPWWHRPTAPRGLPLVLEVLAIVIALSVLLAFYQVVRSAVHRGDNLALARAEQARATHHCNTLSGIGAGEACLQRLNAAASMGKGAL